MKQTFRKAMREEALLDEKKPARQAWFHRKTVLTFLDQANPAPMPQADVVTEYFVRALLFFFPMLLPVGEGIWMGFTVRDICFYALLSAVAIWSIIFRIRHARIKAVRGGTKRRERRRKKHRIKLKSKRAVIARTSGILLFISIMIAQLIRGDAEIRHTALYSGCLLLMCCVGRLWSDRKYYLQLFFAALFPVYFSFYYFVFTGQDVFPGTRTLLLTQAEGVPFLLLGCFVSSILYVTGKREYPSYLYAGMSFAGFMLLFLYGGILPVCLAAVCLSLVPAFYPKETERMKKTLTLLFLLMFASSSAPLISYMDALGLNRTFRLEYSIYIDIIICVFGLIVTSWQEKTEGNTDQKRKKRRVGRFYGYYWTAFVLFLTVVLTGVLFVNRIDENELLPVSKVFYTFLRTLRNEISASAGEWGYILRRYGVTGMAAISVCMIRFVRETFAESYASSDAKSALLLISLVFVLQGLFYPLSLTSAPYYAVFGALAMQSLPPETGTPVLEQNDL